MSGTRLRSNPIGESVYNKIQDYDNMAHIFSNTTSRTHSIRNIWIRESSLEEMRLDMLAGSGCCVKAKHKAYNLYTAWSRRGRRPGELLLCWLVWRIHPFIIVIGESKATRTGLHCPPLVSKKESV